MFQGRGKVKNIYPGGNTAQGFYSLYDSALQNLQRLFILKGGPGTGKSTIIRQVGLAMVDRGYDIEFLHCSSDNRSLDGVIIPAVGIGVVDGTAPHVVDPKFPGAVDEIVNLGECWNDEPLRKNRDSIVEYTTNISRHFGQAYTFLKEALEVEASWEAIIGKAMDFARVEEKTGELLGEIFSRAPRVRHLFAGALTPEGNTNYMENLTEDCEHRYILRGEPGSGKSTLIAKVAQEAVKKGFSIDLFHCALDPGSVDMVVIPYLKTAVLDGSPPHFIEPCRPGDKVIDLMEFAEKAVLEREQTALRQKKRQFEETVRAAVGEIAEAKKLHDHLETYYIEAMDFDELDAVRERVINKILHLTALRQ